MLEVNKRPFKLVPWSSVSSGQPIGKVQFYDLIAELGEYMTETSICEYKSAGKNGAIDLEKTIATLRNADRMLDCKLG